MLFQSFHTYSIYTAISFIQGCNVARIILQSCSHENAVSFTAVFYPFPPRASSPIVWTVQRKSQTFLTEVCDVTLSHVARWMISILKQHSDISKGHPISSGTSPNAMGIIRAPSWSQKRFCTLYVYSTYSIYTSVSINCSEQAFGFVLYVLTHLLLKFITH